MPRFLVAALYESKREGTDTLLNVFLESEEPADLEDADDVARRIANGEDIPEGWSVIHVEWRHPEKASGAWRSSGSETDLSAFSAIIRSTDLRVSELDEDGDLESDEDVEREEYERARRRLQRAYDEQTQEEGAPGRTRKRKPKPKQRGS